MLVSCSFMIVTLNLISGDACFPGGTEELSDSSLYQTALREAEEEVNLKPHQVRFVGFLPPRFIGLTSFKLCHTALVTLAVDVSELQLEPNEEVDELFWMPLKLFLGGGDHHWQEKGRLAFRINVDLFHYESANGLVHIVWGFTASLCILAAVIIYGEPPHFPYSFHAYELEDIDSEGTTFVRKKLRLPDGGCKSKL